MNNSFDIKLTIRIIIAILGVGLISYLALKDLNPLRDKKEFISNCASGLTDKLNQEQSKEYCSCIHDKFIDKYGLDLYGMKMEKLPKTDSLMLIQCLSDFNLNLN